jgi:single-strand DNA-binding protein
MSSNVTLIGNVTRDPELRYTASGQAITTFGLAVNRRWQNRQSQAWEETTSFFDVVCWADLGVNVSDSLSKGDRIIVSGRLEQRSWETQDGEKRSKIEVVADELGPSLRWATARAQKTDRRGQGQGGYGPGGGQGGYSQSPGGQEGGHQQGAAPGGYAPQGGAPQQGGYEGGRGGQQGYPQQDGGYAPAGAPAGAGYDNDEEPF